MASVVDLRYIFGRSVFVSLTCAPYTVRSEPCGGLVFDWLTQGGGFSNTTISYRYFILV